MSTFEPVHEIIFKRVDNGEAPAPITCYPYPSALYTYEQGDKITYYRDMLDEKGQEKFEFVVSDVEFELYETYNVIEQKLIVYLEPLH